MQAIIVLFAVFAVTVANTTVFATLGLYGRSVGLSELEVGLVFASSGLLFSLTSSRWGRLSDRVGRAPVMAAGLAATALSLFLFAGLYAAGGTFVALLSARAIYGLLAGSIQPAATAWMADHTLPDRRAAGVALVGAAVGIASIAGSVLAVAVIGFGLSVPVLLGGGLAALAATTVLGVREARPSAGAPPAPGVIDGLAPYLLVGFALVVGFGALQPTTAFFVQDRFSLATADAIRQASLASAGFSTCTFIVQAFVVRQLPWLPRRLMGVGLATCVLAIGLSFVAPTAEVLIVTYGLLGAGYGLSQAGLVAGASMRGGKHGQGQVAGKLQAAMSAAWIVGALGGTVLYPLSILAPLLVASAAMMLALGFAYVGVSPATSHIRR